MVDPNDTTLFHDMFDCIHVDKKWFYLAHDRQQFLLANEQIPPQHCVCLKGHITKVMFLCAVVHPSSTGRNQWWDGKLSIWLFGTWE